MLADTLTFDFNGTVYEWARLRGVGCWLLNNCIVHLSLHNDLTIAAKKQGLSERYNFARVAPKPKKEKAVRTRSGNSRPRRSKTAVRIKIKVGA